MSKIGVHIVQGPRNGYGDFLRKCSSAGQPVVVVKAVDDFAPLREAKTVNPATLTVGRFASIDADVNLGAIPADEAGQWLAKWKQKSLAVDISGVDIWESLNEISSHWEWQADFYIELARLSGWRLALYSTSTGNPPRPEDDGGLAYRAIARCCSALKDKRAVLSLHEYGGVGTSISTLKGTEPYHALRYRTLAGHLLSANGFITPMIISESAQNGGFEYPGLQVFADDFSWYDAELMKDGYVLGVTCYTLGNWENANFQDALPWMSDYIVSHPTPSLPPPDPLPNTRTWKKFVILSPQDTTQAEYDQLQAVALPTKTEIAFSADSAFARPGNVTEHKVAVYAPGRWQGGRAGLESFVAQYYTYSPATMIEYREFAGASPVEPFKLASPVPSIPLVITDPFNAPRNYANGKHEGIDLRSVNAAGSPVDICACADGVVVGDQDVAGSGTGYGITIVLEHKWPDGNTYRTWYAHLTRNYVTLGQSVKRGQPVGLAGKSGTTAIHLHLNLQWLGHGLSGYYVPDVVDPVPYLPPINTTPPPTPSKRALVGLHLRANGLDHNDPSFAGELDLIRRGRIQAVKFTTNSSFESLDALLAANISRDNIVVRLFMAGNDPNLRSPDTFYFYLRSWVAHAVSRGVLRFEVHNEPNLSSEGLGFAWTSAAEFAGWYDRVRSLIKAEFPTALVGFPGLSPQSNTDEWLTVCAPVIVKSDWVGGHSYWQVTGSGTFGMLNTESGGMYWKRYATRFPGKPIYLTEFSNNNPDLAVMPKHQKGLQYVMYYDMLYEPVVAAFSFVSSAPSGFGHETWAGSDIADVVGARSW